MGFLVDVRQGIRSVARYFSNPASASHQDESLLLPELYTAGKAVRFVVISDTHNGVLTQEDADRIPDADVFLCCGDITETGSVKEVSDFNKWLGMLAKKKEGKFANKPRIVIGGNHDRALVYDLFAKDNKQQTREQQSATTAGHRHKEYVASVLLSNATNYLEYETISVDIPEKNCRVSICGCPCTELFPGATASTAFVMSEKEQLEIFQKTLATRRGDASSGERFKKEQQQRDDDEDDAVRKTNPSSFVSVDVLMTHGPPRNVLDVQMNGSHIGSLALSRTLVGLAEKRQAPLVHVFGHVHRSRGVQHGANVSTLLDDDAATTPNKTDGGDVSVPTTFINAASVTGKYYVFDLDCEKLQKKVQ